MEERERREGRERGRQGRDREVQCWPFLFARGNFFPLSSLSSSFASLVPHALGWGCRIGGGRLVENEGWFWAEAQGSTLAGLALTLSMRVGGGGGGMRARVVLR